MDAPQFVARQSNGKLQGEIAARSFIEQTCVHSRFDGMQLHFRERAFETEQEAAVGYGRIIDAVAVCDQAALEAADVEQGVPVRAVAREASDFGREDDPDEPKSDFSEEIFESFAMMCVSARPAEIGINDLDVIAAPAEVEGAFAEGILQVEALLIGQDLMRS